MRFEQAKKKVAMSVGGRPLQYPVKKVIGFDYSILSMIEAWRRNQDPIPTVSDAIRALLTIGASAAGGSYGPATNGTHAHD